MATDVRHTNISDIDGKVYCYKVYSIVELDGPHLSEQCWICPFWAGLAGGYGVECMYEDDKVMNDVEVVKFRNPEDAKDHAPKKASNLDSAASKFGVKANDARAELIGKEKVEAPVEETVTEVATETAPSGPTPTTVGGPTSEEAAVEMATEGKSKVEKMHDMTMHEEGVCPHCGVEMKDGKCQECGYSQEVMIQASFAAEIVPDLEPEMKSLLIENGDKFVDLDKLIAKTNKDGKGLGTADPGLFTRCVAENKNRKGITDVESYCASVHQKITGMWPGEHEGKNKRGPEMKKSTIVEVVTEVIKHLPGRHDQQSHAGGGSQSSFRTAVLAALNDNPSKNFKNETASKVAAKATKYLKRMISENDNEIEVGVDNMALKDYHDMLRIAGYIESGNKKSFRRAFLDLDTMVLDEIWDGLGKEWKKVASDAD